MTNSSNSINITSVPSGMETKKPLKSLKKQLLMKLYHLNVYHQIDDVKTLKILLLDIFEKVRLEKPFTFDSHNYEERIKFVNEFEENTGEHYDDRYAIIDEIESYQALHYDNVNRAYFSPCFTDSILAYESYGAYHDSNASYIIGGTDAYNDTFYCDYTNETFLWTDYATTTEDGYTVHTATLNNLYYHEDSDCYYLLEENLPEEEEEEVYLDSYHSRASVYHELDENFQTTFKVGFEAEKEDKNIREYCSIDDFNNDTDNLWRKESDGSLDSQSGFELISPYMKLSASRIKTYIESSYILKDHINADSSKRCGGHVHLSCDNKSGYELYDMISGYFPILLAMYRGRIRNSYSAAGSKDQMKSNSRMAINVKNDRIEIRVFSAIKNAEQLNFRLLLLEYICNNPTDDFKQALGNIKSQYKKLFSTVYTKEQFNSMLNRSEVYSVDFEFATSQEIDN